jgi:hypothetical protein
MSFLYQTYSNNFLTRKSQTQAEKMMEAKDSIEEEWSDIGEDLQQELDTLPSVIHKFIKIATTSPDYISNTSHPHSSLANIYAVATTLQTSITPNTPPLKRNITLRDLAQRLHLWPTDIIVPLQADASLSVSLLNKYIKATLKQEMEFMEGCHAKEKLKETKVFMQIGGYHGAGKDSPTESLRKLGTLSYQACLVLERLEKILRMQVEKGVLEGEENLELKDLWNILPESNIFKREGKTKIEMREGLGDNRFKAFKAVENYRKAVNTASNELLRFLNEKNVEGQAGEKYIWDLREGIGKLSGAQTEYRIMKGQLRVVFDEERHKETKQRNS